MDKKLTDSEIKTALKGAILNAKGYDSKVWSIEVYKLENALDLINRLQARVEKCEKVEHFADKTIATLQAENERLKIEKEIILKYHPSTNHPYEVVTPYGVVFSKCEKDYDDFEKDIQVGAIEEFWVELKTHSRKMQSSDFGGEFWDRAVLVADGDKLLKKWGGTISNDNTKR